MNIEELAFLYKPIFIFDKLEKYYPCSVEHIISNSQLYNSLNDKEDILIKDYGKITPEILSQNIGNSLQVHHSAHKGDLKNSSIYYFYRSNTQYIDIIYFLYFAYSAPFIIFGKKIGGHDTDLENLIIRFDIFTKKPISIYFNAHGDEGKWVDINDVIKIKKVPVIFVARNSHAFYPENKTQIRLFGLANDKTSFGKSWTSDTLINVKNNNPIWMKYIGKWSRDGVDSVVNKDWWKVSPIKSSKWYERVFPINYFKSLITCSLCCFYKNNKKEEKEDEISHNEDISSNKETIIEIKPTKQDFKYNLEIEKKDNEVQINEYMKREKNNDEFKINDIVKITNKYDDQEYVNI